MNKVEGVLRQIALYEKGSPRHSVAEKLRCNIWQQLTYVRSLPHLALEMALEAPRSKEHNGMFENCLYTLNSGAGLYVELCTGIVIHGASSSTRYELSGYDVFRYGADITWRVAEDGIIEQYVQSTKPENVFDPYGIYFEFAAQLASPNHSYPEHMKEFAPRYEWLKARLDAKMADIPIEEVQKILMQKGYSV